MVKAKIVKGNKVTQVTRSLEKIKKMKNKEGVILSTTATILLGWKALEVKTTYYKISKWKAPH